MNAEILDLVKKYSLTFKNEQDLKKYTEVKQIFTNSLNDLFSLYGVVKSLKEDERGWVFAFKEDNGFEYYTFATYLDKQGNKWARDEIYTLMSVVYA